MSAHASRRDFLKTTAAAGIGYWVAGGVAAKASNSPNEKVRLACIGVGGKGQSDSADAGKNGEVVAICDVDELRVNAAGKRKGMEKAKKFQDFRKLLEAMEKQIDAVTVSTTDHVHAPASVMAMRMGKHCFCQKPLTHTIYEARVMGQVAREMKVATQMGNQGTAQPGLRHAAAIIRAGVLGNVSEVHVWTNRPVWPQGGDRAPASEAPKSLNWDLWIGPAPMRPYAEGYHPFKWRGWWDFGTGALGDMACHTVNMPFMALDMRDPLSVQAVTSGHNKDSYPKWSKIEFEFGATAKRPAMKLFWYDGGQRPSDDILPAQDVICKKFKIDPKKYKPAGSGMVIIGDKAKLYSPDDYGARYVITPEVTEPEVSFPHAPNDNHFEEWIAAIKGGPAATSNFPNYAGPLTETILLGNLAVWAADKGEGKKILWDAKNLKTKNAPEVEHIVKTEYRKGYSL
jgi:predicted dehydrogenase